MEDWINNRDLDLQLIVKYVTWCRPDTYRLLHGSARDFTFCSAADKRAHVQIIPILMSFYNLLDIKFRFTRHQFLIYCIT